MKENVKFLENGQKRGYCRNLSPSRIFKLQHRDAYHSMRKDHIYRFVVAFFEFQIFVDMGAFFPKFSKIFGFFPISLHFFQNIFKTITKLKKSYDESLDISIANRMVYVSSLQLQNSRRRQVFRETGRRFSVEAKNPSTHRRALCKGMNVAQIPKLSVISLQSQSAGQRTTALTPLLMLAAGLLRCRLSNRTLNSAWSELSPLTLVKGPHHPPPFRDLS